MRKVKFTQQNYSEKLGSIIDGFPKLDDIHPFYSDLMNVLYSKDQYKVALGQVNTARRLIDKVGQDYLQLIKIGDSLYRCKSLKKAALGRMCTIMKKLNASLTYLERVRQHLSRLPAIEPNTRTLIITGYPNVGKSSFVNKVSRANVDVQPYPFTTKSLFVGHMDFDYFPWQVIDTPGILDRPLEERTIIEMQAITALAHLHATILFFIDISEKCGHTIKEQVALYNSVKPLFANKPLLIVATKTDLRTLDEVPEEDRNLLEALAKERNTKIVPMSNVSDEGIGLVKQTACKMLLAVVNERKQKSKKIAEVMDRIHVAQPAARDAKERPTSVPDSVRALKAAIKSGAPKIKRKTERDIESEQGGPGVYAMDYRKLYQLDNPDWIYDVVPEIVDGMNIVDFVDPEIEKRLEELEAEEEQLLADWDEKKELEDDSELDEEEKKLAAKIKSKQKILKQEAELKKSGSRPSVPRKRRTKTLDEAAKGLADIGIDPTKMRARSKSRGGTKRRREEPVAAAEMEDKSGGRSKSRNRSRPAAERSRSIASEKLQKKADKLTKDSHKKIRRAARAGEGDKRVLNEKPRHLFSGKRGIGKTDRR